MADLVDPYVTVLIRNYNGKELLSSCISSLLKQTYKNFEIIVVDGNSTDGSVSFIETTFPLVKIIKDQNNFGASFAANLGVKNANGTYIAILDNDNEVDPNWLLAFIKAVRKDDENVIYTSINVDSNSPILIDSIGATINFLGYPQTIGNGKKIENFKKEQEVFLCYSNSVFLKKSDFLKIGGFDDSYFIYLDDIDFFWRARLLGFKIIYIPTSITYHKISQRLGSVNPAKIFYVDRNRITTIIKNYSTSTLLKILALLISFEILTLFYCLITFKLGLLKIKLKSIYWNIINLHSILKKRKHIQSTRIIKDSSFSSFINAEFVGTLASQHVNIKIINYINPMLTYYKRYVLRW